MTTTPTSEQIAELKAAGYFVTRARDLTPTTKVFVWRERGWTCGYDLTESEAWSAAWAHYQTQRKS
jgi:hypothetical protein